MGRGSGSGLGLAVVWGTVKDHNGYVDIHSTVGKGGIISIYFPCSRKALKTAPDACAMDAYCGKDEKILIVDDVAEQLEISSAILKKLGYAAATFSSGEAALEYLSEVDADLILLDMVMEPGMDGLDAYREILALRPAQKAVIASGFSETARVKENLPLGAGSYIRKPYTIEKIGVAVRDALDGEGGVMR
jgi:CheY-like chemotaxis protein